jgi:acyl dehydratase
VSPPPYFFDDLEVGMRLVTPRRTITEADIVQFAGVSGDFQPIHTDHLFAREIFGKPIAHGLLVLSVVTGLRTMAGWFVGTVVAFLEIRSWRFLAPVFPGDTLYSVTEILEKRPSQKPDRGVVIQKVEVFKAGEREEKVQEGEFVTLLRRRDSR